MNIVYFGVDNPIEFSVGGTYDDKKIALVSNCGQLRKIKANKYIWNLCGKDSTHYGLVNFEVLYKNGKKKLRLGNSEFRILHLPNPRLISWTGHFREQAYKLGPRVSLENDFEDLYNS